MTMGEPPVGEGSRLGDLLRRARLSVGVQPDACADILGVNSQDYEAFENGAAEPSLPQMELLSRRFGIPITYFWEAGDIPAEDELPIPPTMYITIRRRMVGVLLRQARLAASQSLSECARVLGVDAEIIADYEYGRRDIPFTHLQKLADFFQVPLTYFVDRDLLLQSEKEHQVVELVNQLPEEMREFVLKPANILYLRLAMLMSELSVETLRKLGNGLLDITGEGGHVFDG